MLASEISEISELKSEQSRLSCKGDVWPLLEQKKSGLLIMSSTVGDFKDENKVVAGETTPDAQALAERSDADIRQDSAPPSQVQINLLAGTTARHQMIFMVI